MKVTGTVSKILDLQQGTSKAGKQWKKQTFIITTDEEYNNIYPLEVFNEKFLIPAVGTTTTVEFNINANEWQGKYFVSLGAWKLEDSATTPPPAPVGSASVPDNLPF